MPDERSLELAQKFLEERGFIKAATNYDVKCRELAEAFLEDNDGWNAYPLLSQKIIADRLAQTIQDTIEDFLADLESDRQQELEAAKDAAAEQKGDLQRDNGRTR